MFLISVLVPNLSELTGRTEMLASSAYCLFQTAVGNAEILHDGAQFFQIGSGFGTAAQFRFADRFQERYARPVIVDAGRVELAMLPPLWTSLPASSSMWIRVRWMRRCLPSTSMSM